MSRDDRGHLKENLEADGPWKKYNFRWVIIITIWTFFLAIGINIAAEVVLNNTTVIFSFMILLLIISLGIFADIIGIAVTSACEKPFHAMASDKVPGAKLAIQLLKNAGPVSNFCNDVIGDICGIVSGVAGASIIINLNHVSISTSRTLLTIILSGFVASLTVGGKAIGKSIAINHSHVIVFNTARFLNVLKEKLGINFFEKGEM